MTPVKVLERWQEAPPSLPKPAFANVYSCLIQGKQVVLWTGNTACREDARWLAEQQIGAIYQCRPPRVGCVQPLPDHLTQTIQVKTIGLVDNSDERCILDNVVTPTAFFRPTSPALLEAMHWIWENVKTNGCSVLLHSTSGRNRAAAVSLAFLLLVEDSIPGVPDDLEATFQHALADLIVHRERFRQEFKEYEKAFVAGSKQPARSEQPAQRQPAQSKQPAQQGKRKQPAGSNGGEPSHKAARHEDPFAHLSGSACDEQQASKVH